MHSHSSIDTIAAWKELRFILSVRTDIQMTDNLIISVGIVVTEMKKIIT